MNPPKIWQGDCPPETVLSRRPGFSGVRLTWWKVLPLVLLGWCCLALPAGLARAAAPSGQLQVAATIVPLGDFCRKIGGDLVQVQVLIPPGASPHAFEPAPSVMARASQARVFVYIGAGLEPWAAKLLRSRGPDNLVVVEAAQGIPLLAWPRHHHEPGNAGDHEGRPRLTTWPAIPTSGWTRCWPRRSAGKSPRAFIQVDPGHRGPVRS